MANSIIQNYINDTSVPEENRANAIALLKDGKSELQVAKLITKKYGDKYEPKREVNNMSVEEFQKKEKRRTPIRSFLKGAGKGFVKGTGATMASMGEKGIQATMKAILPKGAEKRLGIDKPLSELKTSGQIARESKRFEYANPAERLGGFAENVAEFFVPGGAVAKGAKALQATKGAKAISSLGRAGKLVNPGIRLGMEAVGAGAVGAIQEGGVRQGMKTAGLTGALGAAGKVISKAAKPVSSFLYRSVIPTTITQKGKDFVKGLDIGEALKKTGVSLSKGKLMAKISGITSNLGGQLDDVIKKAKPKAGTYKIEDITKGIKKDILGSKESLRKLGATPADIKKISSTIDDVLNDYNSLYKGKRLDLDDVQNLKLDLGVGLESQYAKAIGASVKAKPLTEIKLRSRLQKIVEKHAPEAREINKQLAPLFEATKRLKKKGSYSGYLTDVIAGGLYAGSPGQILDNPGDYIKNILIGVLGKRAITSTAGKTAGAATLKKIERLSENPKFIQALRELLEELTKEN